ncbi:hypothetical protein AQ490_22965 [Wenjunlia vitaminophila]|uniref:DUF6879 domain-containing protein n=1 Tax=Wenjunlia vitaminophila TaxID=76728 RepID=A0A0T6LRX5_WENVI|nr:DUF6879 family protein [Wenjunlia vitaminophila]KRV48740.1 hypothetical protein AQ490_22965 [Wenjunlia vitaminophila]
MPELLSFDSVEHLFEDFQHTAWRLETRRGYASDRQSEEYRRFLRGEDATRDLSDPWYASRRKQTAQGKRFERVRLVDTPPTKGQLYLLHSAQFNIAAGEDIRNMYRSHARRLGLPDFDFWLFDSRILIKFHFDDDDHILGVELIEEPKQVVRACQARDAAWHHAIRNEEFKARVFSPG